MTKRFKSELGLLGSPSFHMDYVLKNIQSSKKHWLLVNLANFSVCLAAVHSLVMKTRDSFLT